MKEFAVLVVVLAILGYMAYKRWPFVSKLSKMKNLSEEDMVLFRKVMKVFNVTLVVVFVAAILYFVIKKFLS